MDASLHQMEHLVPDRGQVQLMGNVELSTVVDPINAPVHFQWVYISRATRLLQWVYISYAARLPSNIFRFRLRFIFTLGFDFGSAGLLQKYERAQELQWFQFRL